MLGVDRVRACLARNANFPARAVSPMNHSAWPARCATAAGLILSALIALPARAVVVSTSNLPVTAVAPGDDPGWNNVAYRGNASAVYLGNRWVLTANHVGEGTIRLSDGREFIMTAGSGVQLNNTGISAAGSPDLRMFRLADDPGLPTLAIDTVRPPFGTSLYMIGAGRDRATGLDGWRVSGTGTATVWTPEIPPLSNVIGYSWLSTSTMRWGMNEVSSNQILINNSTVGFSTRFYRFALSFEAQAVTGDSGGGVFRFVDDQWKLVGIMSAQSLMSNQPAATTVFSNITQIADLATYRSQILGFVNRVDPAWQNQRNFFDVNGSGFVSPLDYLVIFNEILRSEPHALEGNPATGQQYYDVSGDDMISQLDALRIINALTAGNANPIMATASAQAMSADSVLAPEPATWVLLLGGILLLTLARRAALASRQCSSHQPAAQARAN